MSICRVFSCVVGRGCLLWSLHPLGNTVSLCPNSFCTPRPNLPITPDVPWLPASAFKSPIMKRTSFLYVSSRRSCRSSWTHSISSSFSITGWDRGLDNCDVEWFALETNRDHFVVFEIASKYCILDSFVEYEGYYISSKGSLPTVVDIMVIWVKFTHSSPFSFADS